jgi:small ligand-binding sensory domain FIST
MIAVGVGHSEDPRTAYAARAAADQAMAAAGVDRADLILVFATIPHAPTYPVMVEALRAATQAPHLIGCSALGVLTTAGEITGTPAIVVLALRSPDISFTPFLARDLNGRDEGVGQRIGRTLKASVDASSLLTILPDTLNLQGGALLAGLRHELGAVPIVGGGASEDGSLRRTFVMCGNEVESNAVAGLLWTGRFTHSITATQACTPIGRPCVVTKASGHTIEELEGRPAVEVLADLLRQHPAGASLGPGTLFLGVPADRAQTALVNGEYLVRNILGIDPIRGALTVAEEIVEGQIAGFVVKGSEPARQDLAHALADAARVHQGCPPAFGLYFNCCGRGAPLYGEDNVDVTAIRKTFGDIPLIGFSTYAEIGPIMGVPHLLTYTGVLTLIGPPPA